MYVHDSKITNSKSGNTIVNVISTLIGRWEKAAILIFYVRDKCHLTMLFSLYDIVRAESTTSSRTFLE